MAKWTVTIPRLPPVRTSVSTAMPAFSATEMPDEANWMTPGAFETLTEAVDVLFEPSVSTWSPATETEVVVGPSTRAWATMVTVAECRRACRCRPGRSVR